MMMSVTLATACYEPELRDCTVACSTENECAAGQTCGADGFCAVPDLAGRCFERPSGGRNDAGMLIDAGEIVNHDALVIHDAAVVGPDAPPPPMHVALTVTIAGKGHVAVYGHGTCDTDPPQDGMCVFNVPKGQLVTVQANADFEWRFDEWTTSTCPVEELPTCSFTPQSTTQVGAKFRKFDGDDD